jgi:M6 family metalloprotease-like protein
MALSPDRRFQLVHDFAVSQGFVSGFPDFHEADHGQGVVGSVYLLPASAAEAREVPHDIFGEVDIGNVPALFRAAASYAAGQGYVGAYPNCHEQDYGGGPVYGVIMLKNGMAEQRNVPGATLGDPVVNDTGAVMMAVSDYAAAQGFAAGFPTFNVGPPHGAKNYAAVLVQAGNAQRREVRISELPFLQPQDERTLVVLCRFRKPDGSLLPVMAPTNFYQQYFFGVGNGSLRDYYADVTHHRVNLVGDVVGWLDIGHVGHTVDDRDLTPGIPRAQAFNWGIEAARASGIQVDSYPRQVVVVNIDNDWGGVQIGHSMLLPHSPPSASNPVGSPWSHSRAMHEFGHVLGLWDSWTTTQNDLGHVADAKYWDQNCIMSYATTGARFTMSPFGEAGPGLNGVYTNKLGGIPQSRVYSVPALGAAHTVSLAPLTHAEDDGALLVQVPPSMLRTNTYWVELHDPSNWDRAMPGARIAIHESRGGDLSYALQIVGGPQDGVQGLGSPNDPAWITPDGSIGIRFVRAIGRNVSVRVWQLGPTKAQEVRISSIDFNPPGDDVLAEHVVIRNDRRTAIAMAEWQLRDDKQHPVSEPFRFVFPNITLWPGEDLVVWTKAGHNDAENLFWGLNHAVWNNRGGDAAVLLDDEGTEVTRFAY